MEVRIPDPGSLAALQTVVNALRANVVVSFAMPTLQVPKNALPKAYWPGQLNQPLDYIANQLAVKASPAWNARRASTIASQSPPVFLIADYFGGGTPASFLLSATLVSQAGSGFTFGAPDSHGYHVLGIAAAAFNGINDTADNPISGLYGSLSVLDLAVEDIPEPDVSGITLEDKLRSLIAKFVPSGRKMVLNTSLGGNNGNSALSSFDAEAKKIYWLSLIRGGFGALLNPVEDQYFHAASAGNNPNAPANVNIGWTRAALAGDLKNTAVVENRQASPVDPFTPGCLSSSSSFGGNISAIGSLSGTPGVWSYVDATGNTGQEAGTSMAAPQVAGLAALFWSIRSDLTSAELWDVIRLHANAESASCGLLGSNAGQPLIDAYATILAADDTSALAGVMGNPLKAPVRLAVLDLDEDGEITYADAKEFVDAFVSSKGASAFKPVQTKVIGTHTFDFSRFDLNGDGTVGGAGVGRFNLDIDYGPKRESLYGTANYFTLPQQKVDLNEKAVTDFQILCYYVYSPMWRDSKGTIAAFESYLATQQLSCSGPVVGVELKVNDLVAGWNGLPAAINMTQLYSVSRSTFQVKGNSATCGNQGQPLGERGGPIFSSSVDSDALFFGATVVTGVPSAPGGGGVNRNNCSSFFAYKTVAVPGSPQLAGKFWANGTGRAVFGFGGVVSDWEYQVRYYSGDPLLNYIDKKVTVGTVPNSGNYGIGFVSLSNSLSYILAPPVQ